MAIANNLRNCQPILGVWLPLVVPSISVHLSGFLSVSLRPSWDLACNTCAVIEWDQMMVQMSQGLRGYVLTGQDDGKPGPSNLETHVRMHTTHKLNEEWGDRNGTHTLLSMVPRSDVQRSDVSSQW